MPPGPTAPADAPAFVVNVAQNSRENPRSLELPKLDFGDCSAIVGPLISDLSGTSSLETWAALVTSFPTIVTAVLAYRRWVLENHIDVEDIALLLRYQRRGEMS